MALEPGWTEVVPWMRRNLPPDGRAPALEAARHFYPGVAPDEHARLAKKYSVWWGRYKDRIGGDVAPAQGTQRAAALPPAPVVSVEPAADLTGMSTVERLEWQLRNLTAAHERAMSLGDLRAAAMLDQRLADVGSQLDEARAGEKRVLKLDRTASAVAEQLAKKAKAIALRAEMQRRAAERARERAGEEG